jgi:hypothetical protein
MIDELNPIDINMCDICYLLDKDERLKPGIFCEQCNAFICEWCQPNKWRRFRAMLKRKLRSLIYTTSLIAILALCSHAQTYEVPCPQTTPTSPTNVTSDPATNQLRAWLCTDSNGHVIPTAALGMAGIAPSLPNVKFIPSYLNSVAALAGTEVPLYTVPIGRRAILWSSLLNNYGATNSTFATSILVGGVYERLSNLVIVNHGIPSPTSTTFAIPYIAEAGETFAVLQTTSTNFWMLNTIVEFDNNSGLKTAKSVSLVGGDNIFYTPTAGKNALILQSLFGTTSTSSPGGPIWASITSSGAISMTPSYFPAGTTVSSTATILNTATSVPTSLGADNLTNMLPFTMASGDSLSVNLASTPTTAGMVWATVVEY